MSQPPRTAADAAREEIAAAMRAEGLSADEWAARHAHTVGASSLDDFRYADPALDAWIHRVFDILRDPTQLEDLRRRLLTDEERARIAAARDEDF